MELIYKYIPLDRHPFLINGLLRVTQPGDQNDPFELIPFFPDTTQLNAAFTFLQQQSRQSLRLPPLTAGNPTGPAQSTPPTSQSTSSDAYLNSCLDVLNAQIGITSFSLVCNNSTMWAHYSSSHAGFCVGFDRNHAFFRPQLRAARFAFGCPKKVIYLPSRPVVQILAGAHFDESIAFVKSTDWRYEQEVRAIFTLDPSELTSDRSARNFPVYLKKFPLDAVAEVLVGYYANDVLERDIISFAQTHKIRAFKMHLSTTTDFAMQRKQIA